MFGLYFFKDKRGNEVTMTDAQYYKMFEQFVSPASCEHTKGLVAIIATDHKARETMKLPRDMYGEQFNWPPNSNAIDFYLWGYFKYCM